MKFISYAQSFEDVMLWRALHSISKGFYIDVGANDPVTDSVTKAFYEAGWHGINLEPMRSHFDDLVSDRPRDINLCEAAGKICTTLEIWDLGIRGWGTLDKEVAERHIACGHQASAYTVPVRPLTAVCEEYVTSEIHFLKVDVEGFEKQVLEGMDFNKYRPWIVVVEATMPNSKVESHGDWEYILLASQYKLVYKDGLNRYYLANEQLELEHHFDHPPNVFDEIVLLSEFQTSKRLESVSQERDNAVHAAEESLERLNAANSKIQNLEHELNLILGSKSWRITKPLRAILTVMKSCSNKLRGA